MARPLYTARLDRKDCLSEPAQCFHLEFSIDELPEFDFVSGQFVSMVADDPAGKTQTRAYSIASAPRRNEFDLCVNRVEGGFFSNLLCDLEAGETIRFHGPHGLFLLRQPLTDSILIATGTGIAPMRGFAEALFPANGEDRSHGRDIWLVYGTRYPTEIYYQQYFEKLAAERHNFHYVATLSRPQEDWSGGRGYVQEFVAQIASEHAARSHASVEPTAAEGGSGFNIHAYICGLNEMVSANRDRLMQLGWQRKQIVFERYD
ncbi:2-polyprenylphenol hydroxylase and related flavodoxin oxidoreductases / CDP-6-deoxy-delta-3,4-glucoseen reductase-like [Acidisarcina polymorpha]|uniref:2-polyprenylphenol hydroxylase and related flavodoxin oxidoreductases / CDP-6-deoxy-delta-3,4-glucoseen reductase-like n=1 Tax=Acidisarcina polymorpha TaxID=2211140 RepID=A0A2Z5G040_9BACT|nr:FAD-dependent oxidoreductase [Acidisarcina polymorpha]AXC12521.1 2-polyprenylphenol hydroxylase and related flavodoxin oxidoreductases / CDP-6-deoxy-delta-3,4-glucoseen reductase-like [Acidisarcina polymorpha]